MRNFRFLRSQAFLMLLLLRGYEKRLGYPWRTGFTVGGG